MKYVLIAGVIIVVYYAVRIWIGSKKSQFYGDSIKNNKYNSKNEAYDKSSKYLPGIRNHYDNNSGDNK